MNEQLKNSVTTADELAREMAWDENRKELCEKIIENYPMRIPSYYLALIDKSDPNDPIARMCIPSEAEFCVSGSFDTSGEAENTTMEGVQHKYKKTALILSTNKCAMYCRHCFRKRLVGLSETELNKRVEDAIAYVKKHEEINNVLITGGDALMNSNDIIEGYLRGLSEINHIDLIRFGSRIPVTLPQRIYEDKKLLELFREYSKRKRIIVVTQFNHPRELSNEADKAIHALQECGVQVRNQTVLLRGVNDSGDILGDLLIGLTRRGVVPYYIFQCRPVTGVKERFQVPIEEGIKIVDEAKAKQNGIGKTVRYAMSHPRGKIEIIGKLPDGEVIFKFHQNKYSEDNAKIFTRYLHKDTCWLGENLEINNKKHI